MNKKLKSHYHCVYNLTYHLVLVTKYRRKCFTSYMIDRLKIIISTLCQKWEVELLEFNGEADHVHYHCVYNLTYHLVLVTKYRRKCFTSYMIDRLKIIISTLCQKWEVELLEFNGEADHVHLLLDMHPNIMPSKFINNLKTVTSRLIRKEFINHLENFYWKPVLWTRAYCLLTTGGATIDTIRRYIEIEFHLMIQIKRL